MNNASEHFSRAAQSFDHSPISQQLAKMGSCVWPLLDLQPWQHWLDFGAGTGLFSVPLAEKVAQVTALDTSAAMLEKLALKQVANIHLLNRDVFDGLPERYDGVISSMALHHVADTLRLLRCLHAALNPGATIALIDLYKEDGSFHGDNKGKGVEHLGFEPRELLELAGQAGFIQLDCREITRIHHKNGREYPLFLLVGKKS